MPNKRKPKLHSLRTRYISLAILLGFVIIIGASISYRATLVDSNKADEMLNQVSQQSAHLERIKELMSLSARSTKLFLLAPQQEHRQAVTRYLDGIISHIDEMQFADQFRLQSLDEKLILLGEKINRHKSITARLFATRDDPMRQYPAMRITVEKLMPIRHEIVLSLSEALAEAKSLLNDNSSPHIYTDIVELQTIFTRMNFEFRLFMVNRNGGFNSASINQQFENIDHMHLTVLEMIEHLKQHENRGELEFMPLSLSRL